MLLSRHVWASVSATLGCVARSGRHGMASTSGTGTLINFFRTILITKSFSLTVIARLWQFFCARNVCDCERRIGAFFVIRRPLRFTQFAALSGALPSINIPHRFAHLTQPRLQHLENNPCLPLPPTYPAPPHTAPYLQTASSQSITFYSQPSRAPNHAARRKSPTYRYQIADLRLRSGASSAFCSALLCSAPSPPTTPPLHVTQIASHAIGCE